MAYKRISSGLTRFSIFLCRFRSFSTRVTSWRARRMLLREHFTLRVFFTVLELHFGGAATTFSLSFPLFTILHTLPPIMRRTVDSGESIRRASSATLQRRLFSRFFHFKTSLIFPLFASFLTIFAFFFFSKITFFRRNRRGAN